MLFCFVLVWFGFLYGALSSGVYQRFVIYKYFIIIVITVVIIICCYYVHKCYSACVCKTHYNMAAEQSTSHLCPFGRNTEC